MTLAEYVTQSDPLSPGTVILQPFEYITGHTYQTPERRDCKTLTVVFLAVLGHTYQYLIKDGSGILYTTDEDGNPKSQSVFKI